jgi:hypothetical protein
MPQRLLHTLTFSLIALLILFSAMERASADSGDSHLHATIDGYTVELVFPGGQPQAGPNTLLVYLRDPGAQPLNSTTVQVAAVPVQGTAAGGHSHTESANADAPDSGHTEDSTREHGGIAQPEITAEEHRHSGATPAPQTDMTPHELTHDEDDQHIDTIMTQLEVGTEPGTYTGLLHFDSSGAWQVQIRIAAAGVNHTGSIAVAVAEPDGDWRILGAFGGVNVLIIAAAGVLKRRQPTTAKRPPVATAS